MINYLSMKVSKYKGQDSICKEIQREARSLWPGVCEPVGWE